jgi:hypothetical protein
VTLRLKKKRNKLTRKKTYKPSQFKTKKRKKKRKRTLGNGLARADINSKTLFRIADVSPP